MRKKMRSGREAVRSAAAGAAKRTKKRKERDGALQLQLKEHDAPGCREREQNGQGERRPQISSDQIRSEAEKEDGGAHS
jgi:hypothetical protein